MDKYDWIILSTGASLLKGGGLSILYNQNVVIAASILALAIIYYALFICPPHQQRE